MSTVGDPSDLGARMDAFRTRVRQRRKALGWSQQRLADEMTANGYGWHQTTAAKVETGQREISLAEAFALAEILGGRLDNMIAPFGDTEDQDDVTSQQELRAEQLHRATVQMEDLYRALKMEEDRLREVEASYLAARQLYETGRARTAALEAALQRAQARHQELLAAFVNNQPRSG